MRQHILVKLTQSSPYEIFTIYLSQTKKGSAIHMHNISPVSSLEMGYRTNRCRIVCWTNFSVSKIPLRIKNNYKKNVHPIAFIFPGSMYPHSPHHFYPIVFCCASDCIPKKRAVSRFAVRPCNELSLTSLEPPACCCSPDRQISFFKSCFSIAEKSDSYKLSDSCEAFQENHATGRDFR